MPSGSKRRRAHSGPIRISPPKKKEKKTRKSPKRKLANEHLSEFDLFEQDKQIISDIVASDQCETSSERMANSNTKEGEQPNSPDFEGFTEEDIFGDGKDSGKIISMLKYLMKGMKDVKDSNDLILKKQSDIQKDVEQIKSDNSKLRQDVNALQAGHSTNVENIEKLQSDLSIQQQKVDDLESKVDEVISKVESGEPLEQKEFPYSKTVVAYNVWYDEGENVTRKAELLIHRHIGQPGVAVKRVKRMGVKEDYDGIVKIELASSQEVEVVLKNKAKLKDHPDRSVNGIYLRQSQPEDRRRNGRNMNTIIRELDPDGVSGLYVNHRGDMTRRRGSGRRGGWTGSRGQPDRGRRGRGGSSSRSRPRQEGIDFVNAWSPSLDPLNGRNVGGRGGGSIGRSSSASSVEMADLGEDTGRRPHTRSQATD